MRDPEEKTWKPSAPPAEGTAPFDAAYRRRQHDAERKAAEAPSEIEREAWRRIAEGWRQLAEPSAR